MLKVTIPIAAALTLAGCATLGDPERAQRMCEIYDARAALAFQDVQRIRDTLDVLDIDEAERALQALKLDRATDVLETAEALADIWCAPVSVAPVLPSQEPPVNGGGDSPAA